MRKLIVNTITMSRAPLAIVSMLFLLNQSWTASWLCFMASVATDVIDGPLARKLKAETHFGKTVDVANDVAIFWIFLAGVALYVWRYHQPNKADLLPLAAGTFGTVIVGLIATTDCHEKIYTWWRTKGNFWCGVVSDAIIILWISWHVGPWALVATVAYGIATTWYSADKVKQFI